MKKTFVTRLALTAFAVGALAQAPSPAPEGVNPPQPPPGERAPRGLGGDRPQRGSRPDGRGMENREFGTDRMLGALAMNPEFGKRLALTPDQQEQLKKLAESQRAIVMKLQAAVTNAAQKQAALMLAEPLDEAALMAAVEETGVARTALAKASITALIEARKVLTEEQRKQLGEMAVRMRARRAEQAGKAHDRMRDRMREKPAAGADPAPAPPPPPVGPPM